MPQMMPLMWTYLLFISMLTMLIIISFLYFFTPIHNLNLYLNKKIFLKDKNFYWNWKW